MVARISLVGSDILLDRDDDSSRGGRIALTDAAMRQLQAWARKYEETARLDDRSALLEIGTDLFEWLDESGWASGWARAPGDRMLEVAVAADDSEVERALLGVPWEVLATSNAFLAADQVQRFVVFRSVGRVVDATPQSPAYRDLALMFMAAAPQGQVELDYEAEEAAILAATTRLPVQVAVEESGCVDFLRDRLALEGPFEVVHLSCHGAIVDGHGPVLALETPEGELALTSAGAFSAALGERKTELVFLSACRSAELTGGGVGEPMEPFARALVRSGVPNVLGWEGSVYDVDATKFAGAFYGELAKHASVPYAAAVARQELLSAADEEFGLGQHWHLARVYTGPAGGGACCAAGRPRRRLRRDAGFRDFLDKAAKRVPVATAQKFVGRRRQAQRILRVFRDGAKAGVLIYGMGNLGKSSLAARIANRMPMHETIVIYERYDALAVFDQMLDALPAREREEWGNAWRERIRARSSALADALESMLEGSFSEQPLLFIVDDLEQILDAPRPGQRLTPVAEAPGAPDAWRESLAAVLAAFDAAESESRLLLTSRFDFTLPDGHGYDWADRLERVQLRPMEQREREKQLRAAARAQRDPIKTQSAAASVLAEDALRAAQGNPGLQEILCRPIFSGELEAARSAIDAVERWKVSSELPPDDNPAQEFFQRVAMDVYRSALSAGERLQLRAGTVFSEGLPVPFAALEAAGKALGVEDPRACLDRLLALGLLDDWGETDDLARAAVNPLARSLPGEALSEPETRVLASAALPSLCDAWQDEKGDLPLDPRSGEVVRLALLQDVVEEAVLQAATRTAGIYLFRRQHRARDALELVQSVLARIAGNGHSPDPRLLLLAANCAERIGERALQIALLEQGLAIESDNKITLAQIAVLHAVSTFAVDPERTLETLHASAALFDEAGDERSRAVTMGKIADILEDRGDLDEALRIRREEQLPVFERVGDTRSWAVTMGKIADVLTRQGKTEEALEIRREEQLPVFDRLVDVRERAVTMGKIADDLMRQGEMDEALRIRLEEELPVFERLGDVRERAITMGKIADVLEQRGETDEVLRIRREEELPVYERVGDVRSKTLTLRQIAQILAERGELDDALVLALEGLPAARELGDPYVLAGLLFTVAQIRLSQSSLATDELRPIIDDLRESLTLYRRIRRTDGISFVGELLGRVLLAAGRRAEAVTVVTDSTAALAELEASDDAAGLRRLRHELEGDGVRPPAADPGH